MPKVSICRSRGEIMNLTDEKVSKPIVLIKDLDNKQWIPLNDVKSVRADAEVKCIVLEEEE
jgi:hypothetical protein